MAREGEPTKLGYLNFDTGGVSTINWWMNQVHVYKYIISTRVNPSSYPINKPTGLSNIPFLEESCNRLTRTQRLGEYQPTRGPKRLIQPNILSVNIYES